jgi:hypothetical protein
VNPGRVSQPELENGRTEGPTSDGATAGAIKGRLSCGVCSGSRTGPDLADAASKVDPNQRIEYVRAAHAVAAATHGPSLLAMALMIGIPLLLLGIAMVLDQYPSWLGWIGLVIGGTTTLAAVGLFLIPSHFPGFLLYVLLGSVIAQLWLVTTGTVMLRRAHVAPDTV